MPRKQVCCGWEWEFRWSHGFSKTQSFGKADSDLPFRVVVFHYQKAFKVLLKDGIKIVSVGVLEPLISTVKSLIVLSWAPRVCRQRCRACALTIMDATTVGFLAPFFGGGGVFVGVVAMWWRKIKDLGCDSIGDIDERIWVDLTMWILCLVL